MWKVVLVVTFLGPGNPPEHRSVETWPMNSLHEATKQGCIMTGLSFSDASRGIWAWKTEQIIAEARRRGLRVEEYTLRCEEVTRVPD
jgi:hypothetical protein